MKHHFFALLIFVFSTQSAHAEPMLKTTATSEAGSKIMYKYALQLDSNAYLRSKLPKENFMIIGDLSQKFMYSPSAAFCAAHFEIRKFGKIVDGFAVGYLLPVLTAETSRTLIVNEPYNETQVLDECAASAASALLRKVRNMR